MLLVYSSYTRIHFISSRAVPCTTWCYLKLHKFDIYCACVFQMVKRKRPVVKKSKPAKVPRKQKTPAFDPSRFVDARASELLHTRFQKRHVVVERDVALSKLHHTHDIPSVFTSRYWEPFLQELSNLIPPELFARDFFSNFFDFDEASLSFSVFVRGQHLRVSPDIIAQVFNVTRVPEPIYPYEESRTEPPSFKAMTLRLFQRPYPNMGGTLYPVSHLSSISLSRVRFLYALLIGDAINI